MSGPLGSVWLSRVFGPLQVGYLGSGRMAENVTASDYEKLTISELEAAARSQTPEARRTHLDQAGKFAALGEKARGVPSTGR
jgi:hypothetical protein